MVCFPEQRDFDDPGIDDLMNGERFQISNVARSEARGGSLDHGKGNGNFVSKRVSKMNDDTHTVGGLSRCRLVGSCVLPGEDFFT